MLPITIDEQAERQGLAEMTMASYGLTDYVIPRHVLIGMQAAEAEERGLPDPPVLRYCRQRSVEAMAKIDRAPWSYIVWGPAPSRRLPSENNVKRRAERFLKRARLLLEMRQMPGSRKVDLLTASLMSHVGYRTLQRACSEGRIPAVRIDRAGGHRYGKPKFEIRIADLRTYLHDKLTRPMIRRKCAALATA